MRAQMLIVAVVLFIAGVFAGVAWPTVKAQAAPDPCVAPWDVVVGSEHAGGQSSERMGWHAVKWNRCTGESFMFGVNNHKPETAGAWQKLAVK